MHLSSSFEILVLLDLLGFSDRQLVQVLVDACHLVSSKAARRHLRLVPVPDRMVFPSRKRIFVAHAIWFLCTGDQLTGLHV